MSISITVVHPTFRHTHVLKMANSGNILHCVEIDSKDGTQLQLTFTGLNDEQRRLVYELFGPVLFGDETAPDTEIEEAETV